MLLLLVVVVIFVICECNLGNVEVDLCIGKVVGKMESDRVCPFVGIPYGKAERWSIWKDLQNLPSLQLNNLRFVHWQKLGFL